MNSHAAGHDRAMPADAIRFTALCRKIRAFNRNNFLFCRNSLNA